MATAVVPRVFKNNINGEWLESASGRAFENRNPADKEELVGMFPSSLNRNPADKEELVGMFPSSTAEDVDAAVDAAAEAFKSWRLVPAPKRAEILYRAAGTVQRRRAWRRT
jgi:aldehyde dehydrogenase (NAD+)